MFNTPAGAFSGGNDFKFVVKGGAKEQVLPFVNSDGQAINIVPTYAPVIKSLSTTTLKTGDELTITGENFTYMSVGFNTNYRYCELLLIKNGETKATLSTYNHRGTTATFKIDNNVESGTYKVVLSSQIHLKAIVFPNLKIENMTRYPAAVSTRRLSDSEYDYLLKDLPKGYVLIEENGKEYKAEFSLRKV